MLLKFLYQNEIELTVPLALDLFAVADKYLQAELMSVCEKYLSRNITLENLLTLIDVVEKFGAETLKSSILKFIRNNFQALEENQTYYLLPCTYIWKVASQLRDKLRLQNKP